MKKLMLTTAAAALMFATAAQAQDTPDMYMITSPDGTHMVVSQGTTSGGTGMEMPVIQEEGFAQPADCPEGSFYMTSETTVAACDDDAMVFDLAEPEEGSMMASGEPWPEGAMMMTAQTRSEEVDPGESADQPQ